MTPQHLRHSALNLRTRAKAQENAERAAAWLKEAEELEAQATAAEQAAERSAKKK